MYLLRAIAILIALLLGVDSSTQSVTAPQPGPNLSLEFPVSGLGGQLGMTSTLSGRANRSSVSEFYEQGRGPNGPVSAANQEWEVVELRRVAELFASPLRLVVERATRERRARVDEAAQRFADQGLDLPSVVVEFAIDNPEQCSGHLGLFRHESSTLHLTICSDLDFVVTHEFAHAWIDANLDEESRRHYTDVRGLGSWADADTEWKDRGVENAAFVIQQNLMLIGAATLTPAVFDRISAYEFLTGHRSPLRPAV